MPNRKRALEIVRRKRRLGQTRIKAFDIAKRAIKILQESSEYNDFSPVELFEETDVFWTFVSASQAMFDDGINPGAFFVSVDKTDGHIWTRREKEDFYQDKSIPELETA